MTDTDLLHRALRHMLDDLLYSENRKGRPWVEARLQEQTWTRAQRWQLVQKALTWARTQDATLAAALWTTLGEETGNPTHNDPGKGLGPRTARAPQYTHRQIIGDAKDSPHGHDSQ